MRIELDAITRATAIQGLENERVQSLEGPSEATGPAFGEVLAGMLGEAATAKVEASQQAEALARGASDDLHGTMIAVKEAEISMKLVGTIRNKLLDAFQELWRTNV
jgi:flagellar hook-basal body complex protein FliE